MRCVHVGLVGLLAVLVACSGDGGDGADGDGRSGRGIGEAAAEVDPAALTGQTDTDLDHWDEGEPWDPPFGTTQRAYGGDIWSTVGGYPQAMNACASAQMRVSWRSLGDPLFAGLTDYQSNGEQETFATPEAPSENATSEGWIDVEADEPATEGEMVLNACEQPVFRTTETNVLVDFVIEVTEHAPAV